MRDDALHMRSWKQFDSLFVPLMDQTNLAHNTNRSIDRRSMQQDKLEKRPKISNYTLKNVDVKHLLQKMVDKN